MSDVTILLIGTFDTKDEELSYIGERIRAQGAAVINMDVSVLGEPAKPCEISKHQVAEAANSSIEEAIASADENHAMQIMARGASTLAAKQHAENNIDGAIILGGTM